MNRALVQKAQQGDQKALNELLQHWYPKIYHFAKKYFADHDLAMEATQQCFVSVFKQIKKLKDPDSFRYWIYKIATNYCHNEERKLKKGKVFSIFRSEGKTQAAHMPSKARHSNPEQSFQSEEMGELVQKALKTIPDEQRVVLIMKEYEGLKFREIAEILKVSENTVKSRLYYGLKALKKTFEHWNIRKEAIYYEA